jgi:L-lactate dehydrogenase complex protein LldF
MTTFLGTPGIGNLRGAEPFPRAARRALGDTQMRRNVGHATHTIRAKRLAAVSECADWEQLRLAGSALKQDVMARLPELLEQLERNVTARGGVVHWARDADDANRIVTDLIRATGADEVVKVKSMATQEIGLNEHLEAEGIGDRDRPRRADRPARPRLAQPHSGARDPPQPRRDPGHLQT